MLERTRLWDIHRPSSLSIMGIISKNSFPVCRVSTTVHRTADAESPNSRIAGLLNVNCSHCSRPSSLAWLCKHVRMYVYMDSAHGLLRVCWLVSLVVIVCEQLPVCLHVPILHTCMHIAYMYAYCTYVYILYIRMHIVHICTHILQMHIHTHTYIYIYYLCMHIVHMYKDLTYVYILSICIHVKKCPFEREFHSSLTVTFTRVRIAFIIWI